MENLTYNYIDIPRNNRLNFINSKKFRYREFEMKDHLGNVRVTFSDLKLQAIQQDSSRLDLF